MAGTTAAYVSLSPAVPTAVLPATAISATLLSAATAFLSTALLPTTNAPVVMVNQSVNMVNMGTQQYSLLVRLLYFIFIGWWLGFCWIGIALALCATIIGLPVGVVMFNFLPAVMTLQRH